MAEVYGLVAAVYDRPNVELIGVEIVLVSGVRVSDEARRVTIGWTVRERERNDIFYNRIFPPALFRPVDSPFACFGFVLLIFRAK